MNTVEEQHIVARPAADDFLSIEGRFGLHARIEPGDDAFSVGPGRATRLITALEVQKTVDGYDLDCPYCGVFTSFMVEGSGGFDDLFLYQVVRCRRKDCWQLVFLKVLKNDDRVVEIYPYPNSTPESFSDSIPKAIREDMAEAMKCYHAGALRMAIVACRRVIQDIARDKKIDADSNREQIKAMLDKGIITAPMSDAAQEIRHFGGYGAHPQDDGLDNITKDIAAGMLDLTDWFLKVTYEMTGRATAFAKRRQAVKQPGGTKP